MFAALGILLLVTGAILTFAVERSADGVDVVAVEWILMAGGGLSLLVAMIHAAGWMSAQNSSVHTERHKFGDGHHRVEEVRQG
jgi:hypothetical protein